MDCCSSLLPSPPPPSAQETDAPQGALIEAAEVSGISLDRLSPGLREDIRALNGTTLDRGKLDALATRIEEEQPEVVAAVRAIARPNGDARVVFLVARISDDESLVENINARYVVESVATSGVPDADVAQDLRDRLQALVGSPLSSDEADELSEELKNAFPGYEVKRRISRGTVRGQIRVVFELTKSERRSIPFSPLRSKFVYHEDQEWSGVLDVMVGKDHRVGGAVVFDNNDDLIEEYSGFRLRLDSRKLATDRVGAAIEFSRFTQDWHDATLVAVAANPRIPEPYRTRGTVETAVTFAFNPHVRVFGGASVSDLESLDPAPGSSNANAWVAGIAGLGQWRGGTSKQRGDAAYRLRAGTESLGSDLVYKRHTGDAHFRVEEGRSTLLAALSLGYITGQAPLFERFSLGDTGTLRGWNKYDIAPAGGDRMWHQSLDTAIAAARFSSTPARCGIRRRGHRARLSAGFGIHTYNFFLLGGFPLNADNAGGTFMVGVRF